MDDRTGEVLETLLGEPVQAEAAAEGVGGVDAAAAAMAMEAAKTDTGLAKAAADYFDQQRKFVKLQSEHLREQRQVSLSNLKTRSFTDGVKAAIQLFIAIVAMTLIVIFLVMIFDALTTRSVVVDAFKAPPALAARGINGETVAVKVLDALNNLQEETRAPSRGLRTQGAWASDIKIEVPQTGVSLGEVNRVLHERLGHDLHIGGDLLQTDAGGLSLTVRGDGAPAQSFEGGAGDLGKLVVQAAEYLYGRSQPWRYAVFLHQEGRFAEELDFSTKAFNRVDGDERANLAFRQSEALNRLGDEATAKIKRQLAMDLSKPRGLVWWKAWRTLIDDQASLGEEAGWKGAQAYLKAAQAARPNERPPPRFLVQEFETIFDGRAAMVAEQDNAKLNGGLGGGSDDPATTYALIDDQIHDFDDAARRVASSAPDDLNAKAVRMYSAGQAALESGDLPGAVARLEAHRAFGLDVLKAPAAFKYFCALGEAYSRIGRQADAMTIFDVSGPSAACAARKGAALARAGDWSGAEMVWSRSLAAAPSLPVVNQARGQAELEHGDLGRAAADFSAASVKAPHWADPLKGLGDVMASKADWSGAAARYKAALAYAPAWRSLQQAYKTALSHTHLF